MTYTDYPCPVIRNDIERAIKAYTRAFQKEAVSGAIRKGRHFVSRGERRRKKAADSIKSRRNFK